MRVVFMKYNHERAEQICKQLGEKKQQIVYETIVRGMKESFTLANFISEIGKEISDSITNKADLEKYIIITAENIYKGLIESKDMGDKLVTTNTVLNEIGSNDRVFGMVLDNLFYSLGDNQSDVIGDVEAIYSITN